MHSKEKPKAPLMFLVLEHHLALRIDCGTFWEDESASCLLHALLHFFIQPARYRNVPLYSGAEGSAVLMLAFVKWFIGKMVFS